MLKKKFIPVVGALAIIFAAALWGLDGVVLRPSLYHLDVAVVVFLEHAIAFAFMAVFLVIEFKELKKLKLKDWGAFFWVAVFGGAIGTMAITKALFYVNFIHLSVPILLQKLQPIFAILLAMLILKEKPRKSFWFWAPVAIIGSYLVTFGLHTPVLNTGNKTFIAAMLGLLAAFAWGSSTVFGKRAIQKVNFRVGTYLRFGLTSIIMFLIIAATNRFPKFAEVASSNFLTLLIIVFSSGGLAIFIYYFGLKKVKASKATLYELAFPITSILLEFILRGKVLDAGQWIGAGLLMFAIYKIVGARVKK